jgi:hypothetical protein
LHNECLDAGSLGVHLMNRDLLLGWRILLSLGGG